MARPVRHRGKWRIRWLDADGVQRSECYTTHNEAAHALRLRQIEADEIKRGLRRAPTQAQRFGELCDLWLETRAPNKKSGQDDASIIRAHLRKAFGDKPLSELTTSATDRYQIERKHLASQTVRNHLVLLGTMLRLAVERNWLESVPRIHLPSVPKPSCRTFRCLQTLAEVQRLLVAALPEGELVHALYATAVFSGIRQGELAALQRSSIDLDRRLIAVTKSHDTTTKNFQNHWVPILDPLLPILRRWLMRNTGTLVFPNQAGRRHAKSARIYNETFHRVLRRAGFPLVHRRGKLRPAITFHDLRHSFASLWVMGGGDVFRLQKILDHSSIELTQRYAHLAPDAYVQDYRRLGGPLPTSACPVIELKKLA